MDWQLSLFRFGLLACFVGALFVAVQFNIIQSAVAVWNYNPSNKEFVAAEVAAQEKQAACVTMAKKTKASEYPSNCYFTGSTPQGLPRDKALANVWNFLFASLALPVLMFLIIFLGHQMARKSGPL